MVWKRLSAFYNQDKANKLFHKKDHKASIAIVLAYYYGSEFLVEQLNSIYEQSIKDFHIYISDDCSDLKGNLHKLNINPKLKQKIFVQFRNKNIGFAKNFLKSLFEIELDYDYYSFCDQDDIWNPNKLERAIDKINNFNCQNSPILYGSRTEYVDYTGKKSLGFSPFFKKEPLFKNALVQNILGGNTMVFNNKAYKLIKKSSNYIDVISHDWWTYLVVSGAGGKIYYDKFLALKYRQHHNNLVGMNNSFKAKLKRFKGILKGTLQGYIQSNVKLLGLNQINLTKRNLKTLNYFKKARKVKSKKRFFYFFKSGVFRQTIVGHMGLIFAVLIRKF